MGSEPGEPADPRPDRPGRELARPPSARYVDATAKASTGDRPSLVGPVARAAAVATVGAAALLGIGAILASTAGLLFISGLMGAGIGVVLARIRVPTDAGPPRMSRGNVTWLAVALAVGAVVVAAIGTWLYAVQVEQGALGLIDYLLATFGPFVPAEVVVAALGAVWGVGAGPLQR